MSHVLRELVETTPARFYINPNERTVICHYCSVSINEIELINKGRIEHKRDCLYALSLQKQLKLNSRAAM